jgi:CDP-2,3-bis-(O-geranylgeranyl)-sn-glycerol synthase
MAFFGNLPDLILKSLWFLVPCYLANMMPVFVKRLHVLDYPVDLGRKLGGKPIFGSHKTYRGVFFGVLAALAGACIQSLLYQDSAWIRQISIVPYALPDSLLLGFLLGFGALFGDLVKSFFKRRVGVAPGKSWFPFDQLDYVAGAILLASPLVVLPLSLVLTMVAISFALHLISVFIGYYLGIRKSRI